MGLMTRLATAVRALRGQVTLFGQQGWTSTAGQGPGAYQQTARKARIKGFEQNAVAHACIRIVTDLTGSVPLQAVRDDGNGDAQALPATHELSQLLASPGFSVNGTRHRKLSIARYLTYGNAYQALIRERTSGPPIALRQIHPEYVQYVYRDRATSVPLVYKWVDEFGASHDSPATDIIHWRDLTCAEDAAFGFPRVMAALLDLETDDEATQYIRQILTNHGAPGVAVMLTDDIEPATAKALEERWREKYVNRGGRGGAVFVGGGTKVEKIGFDLKELEFPGLRAIAREDICAVFGVDPRMVGVQSAAGKDAGMSGVQFAEARQRLYLQTGAPLMLDLQAELDETLAPEFGADVHIRHDPDRLADITENMDQSSKRLVLELLAGGISIEEFREQTGREPELNPKHFVLIPTTSTLRLVSEAEVDAAAPTPEPPDPVAMAAAVAAAKNGGGPPGEPVAPVKKDGEGRAGAAPLSRVLARGTSLSESQRHALWAEFDTRASREESRLRTEALLQFAVERSAVAAAFTSATRSADPTDAPDDTALLEIVAWLDAYYAATVTAPAFTTWRERFRRVLGPTMDQAAADLAAQINVPWDLENPRVRDAIDRRVTKLAGEVTSTTRAEIRALIATGREAGLGVKSIARMIDDAVFEGRNETRATLIARTELVGALNEGEYEAARSTGVITHKRWLSKRDPKVRDPHAAADDEGAIPLGARFEATAMLYPGDPAGGADQVCHCRCTLLFDTET